MSSYQKPSQTEILTVWHIQHPVTKSVEMGNIKRLENADIFLKDWSSDFMTILESGKLQSFPLYFVTLCSHET